ncbi:MAG: hypothetical protein RLW62_17865, partial [Gammaproteobacteria bacterium]
HAGGGGGGAEISIEFASVHHLVPRFDRVRRAEGRRWRAPLACTLPQRRHACVSRVPAPARIGRHRAHTDRSLAPHINNGPDAAPASVPMGPPAWVAEDLETGPLAHGETFAPTREPARAAQLFTIA